MQRVQEVVNRERITTACGGVMTRLMMGGLFVGKVALTDQAVEYILDRGGSVLAEESRLARIG